MVKTSHSNADGMGWSPGRRTKVSCPLSIFALSAGTVFSFISREGWRDIEGGPKGLMQSGHLGKIANVN